MSANTYGRQVVIPLTNKSGGGVVAGDVVVVDTSNNDAFTTTTSAGFTGGVGIAQETIANNATGRVLVSGYAALVNVNASVTRGHFGKTHTVAKQATDAGAARGVGTFCQFLTGGTTPDALMYPVDLLGSSLTNPMTTKGDMITADSGGSPTALTAGSTSGHVLTSNGSAAFPSWQAAAAGGALIYIAQTILGAPATNVTFTGISGSYRDLVIVALLKTDRATFDTDAPGCQVGNGSIDTGSNYAYDYYQNGTGASDNYATAQTSMQLGTCAATSGGTNAAQFASLRFDILNYVSTSQYRQVIGDFAHIGPSHYHGVCSGVWLNAAAAIDQVRLIPINGTNFVTGSRVTLYGRG